MNNKVIILLVSLLILSIISFNVKADTASDLAIIKTNTDNSNQIYLFMFIFALVFLIIGYIIGDNYFKTISGMAFTVIGIYIIRYGFYNLNNEFIKYAVSIICMGFGFYLMIRSVLMILQESMG